MVGESRHTTLTFDQEVALGTYHQLSEPIDLDELARADLRGRGGSGGSAHRKWLEVSQAHGSKVVVANGEEGEPSSAKDRWLLSRRPHAVIAALTRAAVTVGADQAVLYLSDPVATASIEHALAEGFDLRRAVAPGVTLRTHLVSATYAAGESTAACRAISGGPALPTGKPPTPAQSGVDGKPTLVANVESLAHALWIAHNGAAAYRQYGTSDSPGTTLVTISGACHRRGVFEIPFGATLREVVKACCGSLTGELTGIVMGGWFGGILAPDKLSIPLTYENVRDASSGFGCGAITLLGAHQCPTKVAADIAAWYVRESAQQCGVCVNGTKAIADALQQISNGIDNPELWTKLSRWGRQLRGKGACAMLDGAANLARSVPLEFPENVSIPTDPQPAVQRKPN